MIRRLGSHVFGEACKVYRSAAYNLADSAATAIPWDAEEEDPYGWHDNSTNNTRITPNLAGMYLVGGAYRTDANPSAAARWVLALRKNNVDIVGGTSEVVQPAAGAEPGPTVAVPVRMNGSSDYFELIYYQSSGAARSLDKATSCLWCMRIGS
jgi:hypothetical protein